MSQLASRRFIAAAVLLGALPTSALAQALQLNAAEAISRASQGLELESCIAFDGPSTVVPDTGGINRAGRLVTDSSGNAWLFNYNAAAGTIEAYRSEGHTPSWLGPMVVTSPGSQVEATIDPQDEITLSYFLAGGEQWAVRYVPGAGWSAPELLFTQGGFASIGNNELAADELGNVVVTSAEDGVFGGGNIYASVFDQGAGSWIPSIVAVPAASSFSVATLRSNHDGSGLYLIYRNTGLVVHRWNSATLSFGPAMAVPGSDGASFGAADTTSRLPAAVDDQGDITVFWDNGAGQYVSNSTVGGVWQTAEVLPSAPDAVPILFTLLDFAADVSADGWHVFGVGLGSTVNGSRELWTWVRAPGEAWGPAQLAASHDFGGSSPTTQARVFFYSGNRALGMLNTFDTWETGHFNGTAWDQEGLPVPDELDVGSVQMIVDGGELLIVSSAENDDSLLGTWLRGSSDFSDLGSANPGTFGKARLTTSCNQKSGENVSFVLRNARPDSAALLVAGASAAFAPIGAATLVPSTDIVLSGFVTDSAGEVDFTIPWPVVPPNFTLYYQYLVVDPVAPDGLTGSNAVVGQTHP